MKSRYPYILIPVIFVFCMTTFMASMVEARGRPGRRWFLTRWYSSKRWILLAFIKNKSSEPSTTTGNPTGTISCPR